MMKEQITEIFDIINDTEDFIKGGWRKEHEKITLKEKCVMPIGKVSTDSIEKLVSEINCCELCELCQRRNNPVPGAGALNPSVMFIGEGPGAEEDRTGIPFVGAAGQYLDKWLSAIHLDREKDCYIGNIIKCRPPGNRDPYPDEIAACKPFLIRQLTLLKPKMIITLGRFAAQFICNSQDGIGRLRGRVHYYEGIPVVPTYHPSAVLRNPEYRKPVWDDLKQARELLDDIESGR
ncbi:MAG: uracil-DNA glycosylase [Spirochaetales bacterium]|nr:uracil-DNA glycosylase [Spirochaetales bacterium]